MNIHGDNYGNAGVGSNFNQTLKVNPEFNSAIRDIRELVDSSDLSEHDKEQIIEDLEKITKLALRDSPEIPAPAELATEKARSSGLFSVTQEVRS